MSTTQFSEPLSLSLSLSLSEQNMVQEGVNLKDEMVVSIATGLVSVTSRASMTVVVIGGVVSTLLMSPRHLKT